MIKRWLKAAETGFEHWGRAIIRFRWGVLFLSVVAFGGLFTQLPKLEFDTSTEGFFHEEDPALIEYEQFKNRFGSDRAVVLMIRPPEVFSPETLQRLAAMHTDLESQLPYLDEIISLVNITSVRGEGDQLIVEDLLAEWPNTPEQREALRKRVMANPLYRDQIISEDGHLTAMVIRPVALVSDATPSPDAGRLDFDSSDASGSSDLLDFETSPNPEAEASDLLGFEESASVGDPAWGASEGVHALTLEEETEFMNVIRKVVEEYRSDDFQIYAAGMMVMESDIMSSMKSNMPRFTLIALGLITVLLLALFRRASGVVLPLLTVVLALFSSLGLMALNGQPFTIISQILPSFLLAVGVGYSVHLLTIFYQELSTQPNAHEAIVQALAHSGLAILITSLTTAGGLLSFAGSGLAPVGNLGLYGAIGVMIAVAITLTTLPALLALLRFPTPHPEDTLKPGRDSLLVRVGLLAVRHPRSVLLGSAVLAAVALVSALELRFEHDPVAWMPEGHELRVSNAAINEEMKGASIAEVVVYGSGENAFKSKEMLTALETFNREAENVHVGPLAVGKSTSMADTLKQIHQALNENRAEFYAIPQESDLIAQELLLFENSGGDDLERQVDPLYTAAHVTVKMPWVNANAYGPVLDELDQVASRAFGELGEARITGMVPLLARTAILMVQSMLESYLIAAGIITLLMILVLGSWKLGLWSIVPNFLPIVLGLGVMHLMDLPLDVMSILVGSIALGLAVDDTIHFFHHFQRYYHQTGQVEEAVRQTLRTTGQAMLFTSVVLSIGFFTYIVSEMNNLFSFGLITGMTILFAFLADLLVSPALMSLLHANDSASAS